MNKRTVIYINLTPTIPRWNSEETHANWGDSLKQYAATEQANFVHSGKIFLQMPTAKITLEPKGLFATTDCYFASTFTLLSTQANAESPSFFPTLDVSNNMTNLTCH